MTTTSLIEITNYLQSCNAPVDLQHLHTLLNSTTIARQDLEQFCHFAPDTYKRNPVSSSKWYEMLVMCWGPGQHSVIHDHSGSSCAFKVIVGNAQEMRYEQTGRELNGKKLVKPVINNSYKPGFVCAAYDIAIHQISNTSTSEDLITLHIYSPPLNMGTYDIDPMEQITAQPASSVASASTN